MATLAILYDIHGNRSALEAVLRDVEGQDVDGFVFGGDYALFGPRPADSVAALRSLGPATWIRGNVDRWVAFPDQADPSDLLQSAIVDCRHALGPEVVDELGALPEQCVIDGTRYCHASPRSDVESFPPTEDDDDERLLAGVSERRVVFGHTHLQFRRTRADGVELVNPGSVGLPFDGDHRAAYAITRDGGFEFRRVAYDYRASAAACRELFGDAEWAVRSESRLLRAAL